MNSISSRRQIRIKEVKDGILVLPGNKYRVILESSAVNFELKSEDEQDVLIDNFQNFLNSLPTPVQIVIRIREVDIDGYLESFMKQNNHETEQVYKDQLTNYSEFIKKLVSGNKILSRRFYIIIPYEPEDGKHDFQLIREQIQLNQDIVTKGLERLGMKTRDLGNLEILELFYSFYNPTLAKNQPIKEKTFQVLLNNNYAY